MSKRNKSDIKEKDNENSKKLRISDVSINDTSSTCSESSQADNNDILFRLIWNNKYIRNKILYYSKSTWRSVLLPKYNNSNEINTDEVKMKKFKKSYGFNYDQINKVRKMLDDDDDGDHIWLLKLKVSRGDPLDFRLNKQQQQQQQKERSNNFIQIFARIKDDTEFYQNLFKNYSKYFKDKNSNGDNDDLVYSIISCDCWAGLQVLVEDLKPEEISISHYLYAINNGSINCAKYLLNKFNFKLNKSQICKLLKVILNTFKIKVKVNKPRYSEVEEEEYQDEDEDNEELDEFDKIYKHKTSCFFGISKSQQIKEFGFAFDDGGQDTEQEYKQVKKNQTILFLKSRIDQDLDENDKDIKLESNILITSVMNYQIHNKPLKFIIESCELILYILKLISPPLSSFQFIQSVLDTIHKNPWKLVVLLSNDKLNEIKESLFTADELNSTITDFSNSHAKIEIIKHLLGFLISFGCHDDFNLHFYETKFNNTYPEIEIYGDNSEKVIISAGFGIYYAFSSESNYGSDNNLYATEHLFKFCKNEMSIKIQFIKDLVQDIVEYGSEDMGGYSFTESRYYDSDDDDDGYFDFYDELSSLNKPKKKIKEMEVFKSFLEYFLKDGNIKLLSLFINEMVKKSRDKGVSFFTEFSFVFACIQSTAVFDLFYTNQYTKNYINIMDFINYYSTSIKQLESTNQLTYQKSSSLLSVLKHFKSNYNQDYIKFYNEFKMKSEYYSNEFFYTDDFFNDFKDKLELELYWSKTNKYKEHKKIRSARRVCEEPPKDLSVNQFIKILESTPLDQKYNYLNNIEIMAYIIEFRNQDLKSGRCGGLVDPFLLFKYYYFSNQLELSLNFKILNYLESDDNYPFYIKSSLSKLQQQHKFHQVKEKQLQLQLQQQQSKKLNEIKFGLTNEEETEKINKLVIIELLRNYIIKPIIKYNYIDDLNLVYQFISNIPSSNELFSESISEIKQDLLIYLVKYNNLNATKSLYEIDKNHKLLFNQTNLNNSLEIIIKYHYTRSIEVIDYLYTDNHQITNNLFTWRK